MSKSAHLPGDWEHCSVSALVVHREVIVHSGAKQLLLQAYWTKASVPCTVSL